MYFHSNLYCIVSYYLLFEINHVYNSEEALLKGFYWVARNVKVSIPEPLPNTVTRPLILICNCSLSHFSN